MRFITVAYYTENSSYAEEAKNLAASLEKLSLPYDLVATPNQGSWQANCLYKPYFIQQMLIRHYPQSLLYLDSDARVQKHPELFDNADFDLGLFYLQHPQIEELVSSTLYFANNAKVMKLIDRWISFCLENPKIWDQQLLQAVIGKSKDLALQIKRLPPTYCRIFDFPFPPDIGPPVIEQFQASRRFKKEMDNTIRKK